MAERSEPVTLTINGRETAVDADGETPFLYVLRNECGLKATRFGCGVGMCGACTVLVDGEATFSCITPLETLAGREVETVEGVSRAGEVHPVVEELIAGQAAQCGYCLPGIVMAAVAHLRSTPSANRASIAAALDGNLCRCGAHVRILNAIERAVQRMQGEETV
ncbi:(2Fe-2S)-binding protein [Pararhizobium mangrovi]|uniref:(2Fe-2S)-binding protein n=1 Tax=Pararhizobium mangrovi TaxID=2590452 RepID=A0A506U8U3_9HYPH|nr:(2Fe-2S)-binding protein [Pararhizobium mangrovi]TPW28989.1 (2Fe-2S)-binding protein [Pararhizobium mangrovi]